MSRQTYVEEFLEYYGNGDFMKSYGVFERHRESLVTGLTDDELMNAFGEFSAMGMRTEATILYLCALRLGRRKATDDMDLEMKIFAMADAKKESEED
tara:strand:- start:292 stop:582 length:291 start_codon:yes stop_codon:yes gene_type:complete